MVSHLPRQIPTVNHPKLVSTSTSAATLTFARNSLNVTTETVAMTVSAFLATKEMDLIATVHHLNHNTSQRHLTTIKQLAVIVQKMLFAVKVFACAAKDSSEMVMIAE